VGLELVGGDERGEKDGCGLEGDMRRVMVRMESGRLRRKDWLRLNYEELVATMAFALARPARRPAY
jgi:hypothetical protein